MDGDAVHCCLLPTLPHFTRLDQFDLMAGQDLMLLAPVSCTAQFRFIDDHERTAADLDQAGPLKLAQHLADMDWGQSRSVRDVSLAQRELHCLAVHHAALNEFFRQIQDQSSDSLVGGPAAEIERQLIGLRPLLDPGLRELFQQFRMLE